MFLWLCFMLLAGESRIDLGANDIYWAWGFTVAKDGQVIVPDTQELQLVVFGKDGKVVRRMGQAGSGPGEFNRIGDVFYLAETNTLFAQDSRLGRISEWAMDGTHLRDHAVPGMIHGVRVPQADILLYLNDFIGVMEGRPAVVAQQLADSEARITLWEKNLGSRTRPPVIEHADGRRNILLPSWLPRITYDVGSDFIAVCFNREQVIDLVDFKGKVRGSVTARLPQHPLEREDLIAEFIKVPTQTIDNMEKPDYRPAIRRVRIDEQNRIWVFGAPKIRKNPLPYQVFDASGKKLHEGKLASLPHVIRGDTLYCLYQNEEDDYFIIRLPKPTF